MLNDPAASNPQAAEAAEKARKSSDFVCGLLLKAFCIHLFENMQNLAI